LPNGIKDLKTVKSGDLKNEGKTIATEKRVAATIAQIPLMAAAHCQRLPSAVSPRYVALDLCYIS
jgi:hypothetical protein